MSLPLPGMRKCGLSKGGSDVVLAEATMRGRHL